MQLPHPTVQLRNVGCNPSGFTGHAVTHCDTCGRYSGDDRITETFHIS